MTRGKVLAEPDLSMVVSADTAIPEVIGWLACVVKIGAAPTLHFVESEFVRSKRQTLPSTSPAYT